MKKIAFHNQSKLFNVRSRFGTRLIVQRRGSILVVVAASLFALMGFCAISVDYGISVTEKNRLQRTCDAAALAGASQLKRSASAETDMINARAQAIATAANNGVTLVNGDIMPHIMPNGTISTTQIRVTKASPRRFLFGAAIGIPNGQVVASALAGRSFATGMRGLQPLGVSMQTYLEFVPTAANPTPGAVDLVLSRNNTERFGPLNSEATNLNTGTDGTKNWPGNTVFNAVGLDTRFANSGNSGAMFQDDLATANNPNVINLGSLLDPLGSNVSSQGNKMATAIDSRIANSSRIMYILVGRDGYGAANSNPKLDLQYFAAVRVEQAVTFNRGNDPQAILSVTFLPGDLGAAAEGMVADGVVFGDGQVDTGISAVRLLG